MKGLKVVLSVLSLSVLLVAAPGGRGKDAVRVGVYLDLSGQTSRFGQAGLNGIRMAADEINARGGVAGRRIELLVRDEEGEPGKAVTEVRKLIEEDRVHALLGEVTSTNTMAAAPEAQRARVPMITPSSTNPRATQAGDYIFRACFVDPFQGEVMAKFAFNTLKARRAAVLADFNSDYNKGLAETFKRKLVELGGRVVGEHSYAQTDREFDEQLAAARAAKPDVIYIPGYFMQAGAIVKQARQMGIKVPLLGADGWDAPYLWKFGGKALNNSYITSHFSGDDPSPRVRTFVAAYESRYGTAPDYVAALGYDATMLLADALRRAGTTDGPRLRDAIAQTTDFPALTGPITINAERNTSKPAVVQRLLDGKFLYHETVHPDEEGRP